MGRLFGTDGARGIAGTELTCELAMQIGRAAAIVLASHSHKKPTIIIGKDTRLSSDMLESAMVAGICSVGANVMLLGVLPTPAVAHLVSAYHADAGVMISASHNPMEYNGIKLFSSSGYKLSDEIEAEIEELILDTPEKLQVRQGDELGRVTHSATAERDYINHIITAAECDLSGMKVVVDCANGSASQTAEKIFSALGVSAVYLNREPDGTNINRACGSTDTAALEEYCRTHPVELGVAFDGDADRCLAVDGEGNLVDGDKMIAILAKHMKKEGALAKDTAVVTVMSNLGFFRFCEENGISACSTKVGDRYVLEQMLAGGYNLGGEQSGHIILSDFCPTGDGQLSAVRLMGVMRAEGRSLAALAAEMERFPQVVANIRVENEKKPLVAENESFKALIAEGEAELGKEGRILVRPSGTEPLVRVMVEGKDFNRINDIALKLGKAVKEIAKG
ncbi:MAG: phosphoglucosamine mutase [Oscillospiraceae bacterium]|nr:phosphoglucosamine mutase [Oscillospiraceae bacterium]